MSPMGTDFAASTFVRTPVSVIRKCLAIIADEEQRKANIDAITQAHLITTIINIAHGFAGTKGPLPDVKPRMFLPFPSWQPHDQKPTQQLDEQTKELLGKLIKDRRIPIHVFTALMKPPENGG